MITESEVDPFAKVDPITDKIIPSVEESDDLPF